MKSNAVNDATIKRTVTQDEPVTSSNALEDAQLLWQELRVLIHAHLKLAALETRRAGESLVTMIVAGVMVAVLLNGAWLGLVIAGVQWLIEQGMVASSAILLAVAANLLVALILCSVIRHNIRYLQFPAILGSLQPMPSKRRDTDKS